MDDPARVSPARARPVRPSRVVEDVACILTFVTAAGRRCFFATHVAGGADSAESSRHVQLPPGCQVQIDALRARLAWTFVDTALPMAVRGPGARNVQMVMTARPDEFERVIFC